MSAAVITVVGRRVPGAWTGPPGSMLNRPPGRRFRAGVS